MRASRGEVDDLFLVHTQHGMHTPLHEKCQMGVGTQAPVGHQDVASVELGCNCTAWERSWVRKGALSIFSAIPVPA